jgi:hypothetical protein
MIYYIIILAPKNRWVEFPWFTKTNNFTKNHLLNYFRNDPILKSYLPDDIKLYFIKRNYLINVRFYIIS